MLNYTDGALGSSGSSNSISFGGGTLQWETDIPGDISSRFAAIPYGTTAELDTNGNEVTLGHLPSSSGGMSKSGLGTLTLTGMAYFSGNISVSGGTLQLGDGANNAYLIGQIQVANNAALVFDASGLDGQSFSGNISGYGSLTKIGDGTLTLTGTNTYSGGTTISDGILQLGNGSTNGSVTGSIVVNANGALRFNSGSNQTFSGGISGSGTITKSGGGTLTLLGSNSASNTTISFGTLQIGSGGSDGSLNSDVANAGCLAFAYNYGQTYSHTISGIGSLTKYASGSGTLLILSGVNTYTGSTTVTGSGGLAVTMSTEQPPLATSSIYASSGSTLSCTVNAGLEWTYNGSITGGVLTKYGPGTLTLGGASSLSGGYVSSGTLKLGNTFAPGPLTVYGTLDLNGQTVSGGSLSGSGTIKDDSSNSGTTTLTVNMASGSSSTFSGAIEDGSGSQKVAVTKSGAGVLTLSGTSTFTGGTTLSGGTLKTGNTSSLGTGAVTINSGTLDLNGSSLAIGRLSGNGNIIDSGGGSGGGGVSTLTVNQTADATYSGVIQSGMYTRSVALAKSGSGTLTLSGNNTYTGGTTVNSGLLKLESNSALGSSGGSLTINGGVVDLNGRSPTVGPLSGAYITNSSETLSTLTVNQATNTTFGELSGPVALIKSGSGTLTLEGGNAYTGGTTLSGGTLSISSDQNIGQTITFQGGVLQITGNSLSNIENHVVNWTSFNGGFDIADADVTFTVDQVVTGSGGVTKKGAGTLVLSNSGNAYTGGTTLSGGTLSISADGQIGGSSSTINFSGGVLRITGDDMENLGSHTVNFAGGGFDIVESNRVFTVTQPLGGAGSLTKIGQGTLVLSNGGNSYAGGTIISGGTLRTDAAGALPSGRNVTLADSSGITLDLANHSQTINCLSGGGANGSAVSLGSAALTVGSGGGSSTFSGVISGTGSLTKSGAGTLTLAGENVFTGGTTISGGTLSVSTDGNIGGATSTINFSGGVLRITGSSLSDIEDHDVNWTSFNGGFDIADASHTFTVEHVMSGAGSLTKKGAGTLLLTNNNTYTGGTTISGGTLRTGVANALPVGGNVTLTDSSGVFLDLNGYNQVINALAGGGRYWSSVSLGAAALTVGSGNGTSTFSGRISGDGSLTKAGTGTLTLSHSNYYSGGTTISNGTLKLGNNLSLGAQTGSLTMNSGTTLDLNGMSPTVGSLSGAGTIRNDSASTASVLTVDQPTDTIFAGWIQNGTRSVC